jgi:4-hydroxybenzoate polyprenyltransferase
MRAAQRSATTAGQVVSARGLAAAFWRSLRPLQWTKNAVVLGAVVFADRLFDPGALATALVAALVFCGLSSAVYLVNDVRDAEQDRLHPDKRQRPIAAGTLPVGLALAGAGVLLAATLAAAAAVGGSFLGVAVTYVAMMIGYTLGLKRLVIVDVLMIAAGFVLRAVAGAVAIDVTISPWLLTCTWLLALFLGFGKRRAELASSPHAAAHRENLDSYTLPMLDQLLSATAAAVVACYTLYTIEARGATGEAAMLLTAPIVAYAVFRYLFLMHRRGHGGRPEVSLFDDRPLLLAVAAWGAACVAVLYGSW